MDPASRLLAFKIHGAKIDFGGGYLRLWKGDYNNLPGFLGKGGAGGEIGFYDYSDTMIKGEQLSQSIGLTNATMRLFTRGDNQLLAEYGELSGWVTAFNSRESTTSESVYTVNTFEFKTKRQAASFANNLRSSLNRENLGDNYKYNGGDKLGVTQQGNKVVVTWGALE
jgi:hypothetical protein